MIRSRSAVAAFAVSAVMCGGKTLDGNYRQGDSAGGRDGAQLGETSSKGGQPSSGGTHQVGIGGAVTYAMTSLPNELGTGGAFGATTSSATGPGGDPECPDLADQFASGETDVCSVSELVADDPQVNLLIVLDKSGSMTDVPIGDTRSKWVSLTDALASALNPSRASIHYGLLLYPFALPASAATCELTPGAAAVNIPVGPAMVSVPEIIRLMRDTFPGGGTPTAAALGSALEYYTVGAGMSLEGQKYVLLITDGGPTCNANIICGPERCTANLDRLGSCGTGIANCCDSALAVPGGVVPASLCLDDAAVTERLVALRLQGIKTIVMGIPGSEPYGVYLDSFAESGGASLRLTTERPIKHQEIRALSELATALQNITSSLTRDCTLHLAEKLPDPTKLNVAIDCNPLPQRSADSANWEYHAESQSIEIKGTPCDAIKTRGVRRIDVVNGCSTIISF